MSSRVESRRDDPSGIWAYDGLQGVVSGVEQDEEKTSNCWWNEIASSNGNSRNLSADELVLGYNVVQTLQNVLGDVTNDDAG